MVTILQQLVNAHAIIVLLQYLVAAGLLSSLLQHHLLESSYGASKAKHMNYRYAVRIWPIQLTWVAVANVKSPSMECSRGNHCCDAQVQQMDCLSSDGNSITDCLPVDGDVWKVQFDKMGSLLATSASDGANSNVCVWELNPEGQWYLLSKIVGGTELDEME